ncbi:MAG: serine protease inhibitor ecotin [Motiliproteus sp.]|jgi:serine protease inhibitor ecotin
MYRRSRKYQALIARLASARAAKERKRLDEAIPADRIDLPDLRRVIEITDFDNGSPVTHRVGLYRSNRIDCYNVMIDGELWQQRIGWSRVLEGLRKALPRLRQFD